MEGAAAAAAPSIDSPACRRDGRYVRWLAFAVLLLVGGPALACPGDCTARGAVDISDLIRAVGVALGTTPVQACRAADTNGSGSVSIAELIAAVDASLTGCQANPTATPTATPSPTADALVCDQPGRICTVAGTGRAQFDGDGRAALDTSLYFPIDVIFDAESRLMILDWNNLRLRRIRSDGIVETIMGTDVEDFPTDGALAADTPLHHTSDMEFDAAGALYLAGDHVPVVFRLGTDGRVFTLAGGAEYGYAGDGGPARAAQLSTPFGVLPDPAGGFWIADVDAHVIRHVDAEGIIRTVAGNGLRGFAGDGAAAVAARLAGPARMQLGPDGQLYFCETRNHVIRRLRRDGTLDTIAGTGGVRGYAGDGAAATAARLDAPYDLRFAPNGDLYVADTGNNVIRRIDSAGIITAVAGDGEPRFAGDGGPAAAASLRRPSAVLFDAEGSLWVADTSNHRVRKIHRFLDAAPDRR